MMKKNALVISGILSIVLMLLEYLGTYKTCDYILASGHQGNCPFLMSDIELILFPVLPLFLFSLITYKMREEVFRAWWRLARVLVPVSMFLILITPAYTHNWMFPVVKGTVAVALSGFFVLASLVQIILAYRSTKQASL